jgi:hypothetical protein
MEEQAQLVAGEAAEVPADTSLILMMSMSTASVGTFEAVPVVK